MLKILFASCGMTDTLVVFDLRTALSSNIRLMKPLIPHILFKEWKAVWLSVLSSTVKRRKFINKKRVLYAENYWLLER